MRSANLTYRTTLVSVPKLMFSLFCGRISKQAKSTKGVCVLTGARQYIIAHPDWVRHKPGGKLRNTSATSLLLHYAKKIIIWMVVALSHSHRYDLNKFIHLRCCWPGISKCGFLKRAITTRGVRKAISKIYYFWSK